MAPDSPTAGDWADEVVAEATDAADAISARTWSLIISRSWLNDANPAELLADDWDGSTVPATTSVDIGVVTCERTRRPDADDDATVDDRVERLVAEPPRFREFLPLGIVDHN